VVYGCDDNDVQLTCAANKEIHVLWARYGKKVSSNCDLPTGEMLMSCSMLSPDVTRIVKFYCERKTFCQIRVSPDFIGIDPCPPDDILSQRALTPKSVFIEYTCVDKMLILPPPKFTTALLLIDGSINGGTNGAIISVLKNTPTSWPLYVYHAPKNKDSYHKIWLSDLQFNKLAKDQNRPVIYRELAEKYYRQSQNILALDPTFWKAFSEDFIFLFQSDSSMCAPPELPYKIEDFLNFDYVGAPWSPPSAVSGNTIFVGNGGFSLRNRTHMITCIENHVGRYPVSEDMFFADCTLRTGRYTPRNIARYFSVESTFPHPSGALGIHGICHYGKHLGCNKTWVNNWLKQCPESEFLFANGKNGCGWWCLLPQ